LIINPLPRLYEGAPLIMDYSSLTAPVGHLFSILLQKDLFLL